MHELVPGLQFFEPGGYLSSFLAPWLMISVKKEPHEEESVHSSIVNKHRETHFVNGFTT